MDNNQNEELVTRELTVTVSGKPGSGKSTLLSIIKNCLERDYVFRTMFAGANIALEEVSTDNNVTDSHE